MLWVSISSLLLRPCLPVKEAAPLDFVVTMPFLLPIHMAKENFEYKQKAWPTEYNGIVFRSRLEATWACFFDQMGWQWDYEPIDLEGWVPDFMLTGKDGTEILVEIKPITSIRQLKNPEKYIRGNPVDGIWSRSECLVLGLNGPSVRTCDTNGTPYFFNNTGIHIGWIYDFLMKDWDDVVMKVYGISNATYFWTDQLIGNEDTHDWKRFLMERDFVAIKQKWNFAKHVTSFKKQSQ